MILAWVAEIMEFLVTEMLRTRSKDQDFTLGQVNLERLLSTQVERLNRLGYLSLERRQETQGGIAAGKHVRLGSIIQSPRVNWDYLGSHYCLERRPGSGSCSINLALIHPEVGRKQQRTLRITGEGPKVHRNQIKKRISRRKTFLPLLKTETGLSRTGTWMVEGHRLGFGVSTVDTGACFHMTFGKQVAWPQKNKSKSQEGFQLTMDREPMWNILSITPRIIRD